MADEKKDLETKEEIEETPEKFEIVDGELMVTVEDETKDLNADSDKEQSDEDNLDDHPKGDEETSTLDEEDSLYRGKSREDIAEMHKNAVKAKTLAETERSEVSKKLEQKDLTFQEKLDLLPATKVDEMIQQEQNRLLTLDKDVEPDKYKEIESNLIVLNQAFTRNYSREAADSKLNERHNEDFIPRMKEKFAKDGIELSDDQFGAVTKDAMEYLEGGVLTERGYQKALIDQFGHQKYVKFYELKGGEDTRKSMAEAGEKESKGVDVSQAGKTANRVKFDDMKPKDKKTFLRDLSDDEFERLAAARK